MEHLDAFPIDVRKRRESVQHFELRCAGRGDHAGAVCLLDCPANRIGGLTCGGPAKGGLVVKYFDDHWGRIVSDSFATSASSGFDETGSLAGAAESHVVFWWRPTKLTPDDGIIDLSRLEGNGGTISAVLTDVYRQ